MICTSCRKGHHSWCRGGTWCPCQHRDSECDCKQNPNGFFHGGLRGAAKRLSWPLPDGTPTPPAG